MSSYAFKYRCSCLDEFRDSTTNQNFICKKQVALKDIIFLCRFVRFSCFIWIILHWIVSPFSGINRYCDTDRLPNPESSLRMSYCIKCRKNTCTQRWLDQCVVRSSPLLSVPACVISFLRLAEWLLVVTFLSKMSQDARVRMLQFSWNTSWLSHSWSESHFNQFNSLAWFYANKLNHIIFSQRHISWCWQSSRLTPS